jgi:hypothetical protein
METIPKPDVDAGKMADEVKSYIKKNKMNFIDYKGSDIQAYPPPDDPEYPELSKFAAQWAGFFDYADGVKEGFPEGVVAVFEAKNQEVADAVNSDSQFWESLRGELLPLYERSKDYDKWKGRWRKIGFWYYPEAIPLATTMRWMAMDKQTKELKRQVGKSELISHKILPPGFVVEIF